MITKDVLSVMLSKMIGIYAHGWLNKKRKMEVEVKEVVVKEVEVKEVEKEKVKEVMPLQIKVPLKKAKKKKEAMMILRTIGATKGLRRLLDVMKVIFSKNSMKLDLMLKEDRGIISSVAGALAKPLKNKQRH